MPASRSLHAEWSAGRAALRLDRCAKPQIEMASSRVYQENTAAKPALMSIQITQSPITVPRDLPRVIFFGRATANPNAARKSVQNVNISNDVQIDISHFGASSARKAPAFDATKCSMSIV